MHLLTGLVLVASGVSFISLTVLVFAMPVVAERFFMAFASSARTHFVEQILRTLWRVACHLLNGHVANRLLGRNPGDVKLGETLTFRVLFQGKPAPNQLVRVSHAGFHAHDASGKHVGEFAVRTDQQGGAHFTVDRKALWYVSLIHMQKVDQPDADYESNWATVTFNIN